MKKYRTVLLVFTLLPILQQVNAQLNISKDFIWSESAEMITTSSGPEECWAFQDAFDHPDQPALKQAQLRFPVSQNGSLSVSIVNARYEDFSWEPGESIAEMIKTDLRFSTEVSKDRNQYWGNIAFVPIIKSNTGYRRLVSVDLEVSLSPQPVVQLRSPDDVTVSALSDGEIYKIAVAEAGIHKISYGFLKDELGIDIDAVNPSNIKLLGDRGGILPAFIGAPRIEDLEEFSIRIIGEEDGRFDPGDYILFYAEGPHQWIYNENSGSFSERRNIYDNRNYYFLKISGGEGRRVETQPLISNAVYQTNTFDDFARFEEDKRNLMQDWQLAQGSGQEWFGDQYENQREYSYNNLFSFPGLIAEDSIQVAARMAIRARTGSSFRLSVNGQTAISRVANVVTSLSSNETDYYRYATLSTKFAVNENDLSFVVSYPRPQSAADGSVGWLDYIEVNARRELRLYGDQTHFRDQKSLEFPSTTFEVRDAGRAAIWEVTDPLLVKEQQFDTNGNVISFGAVTEELRTFVVFDPSAVLLVPQAVGKIENQNLHGLTDVEMLIIYHPDFQNEVTQLADHRREFNGYNVETVTIDQVMNEFAGGAKDPTAIRDFVKLLYDRSPQFKYVLLFGDGSFDPRDIYGFGRDFIPTYQKDSANPIFAFPTDDYYAILENNNAQNPLAGELNIALGRLPVNNQEEARTVVDKIIRYDKNPNVLGEWRNRLVFVGDDEDDGRHVIEIDRIATLVDTSLGQFNIDKIYFDAFPQVSTPGGNRFPAANEALNRSIFRGTVMMTYLGHGGAQRWAQESVLNLSDINSWENIDQLPIFITATCSFAGYDDVTFTTAGEQLLLNPRGGAVALLTTTRAVFASQNERLTREVIESLFALDGKTGGTIGEAMVEAKNIVRGDNSRKFTLLGDPAQRLALPRLSVRTETINGVALDETFSDTLRALERVTVTGVILGNNGEVFDPFNGEVIPTVFDKPLLTSTLGQDRGSPVIDYTVQRNLLFKGRATVTNGRFQFTFVVPKDINFEFGAGRISYYAADEAQFVDATGGFNDIIIGGVSDNILSDDKGPKVEVFMNGEGFAFGGITDENPILVVKLEDDNGINVVGNSIGHDLEGTLDEDTENTFVLNDFYEAELNDYRKGAVRYPLSGIEVGRHSIRVKAWDVANNSSEGYTEFVVAESAELALERVLNYPNPFTDRTCFQFDYNLAGQELEVIIQIFTVSGRLVKTIEQLVFANGALRQDNCIEWDGRDDYGDRLGRGVYLYKVKARTIGVDSKSKESEFEKLVILK